MVFAKEISRGMNFGRQKPEESPGVVAVAGSPRCSN